MRRAALLSIVIATTLCLSGCGAGTAFRATFGAKPAAVVATPDVKPACGNVREWDADFEHELAGALAPLPRSSPLWTVFRDAVDARRAVHICRGEAA